MAARTTFILLPREAFMEFFSQIADLFLHLDVYLNDMAGSLGPWLYVILFAVIFAETGLVVTPFLPGKVRRLRCGCPFANDRMLLHLACLLCELTGQDRRFYTVPGP